MAHRVVKLALAAGQIPFVASQASRAALVPDLDMNTRVPRQFWGDDNSLDIGQVQVDYVENIMPVAEGWCSVSYTVVHESLLELGATIVPTTLTGTPAPPAPAAGYSDCSELYHSDPLDTESAGLAAHPDDAFLLTNEDVLYLITGEGAPSLTGDLVIGWIYYPVKYDKLPRTLSTAPAAAASTIQQSLTSYQGYHQPLTTAYAAGVQLICVPGAGLVYYGTVKIEVTTGAPPVTTSYKATSSVIQWGCTDQAANLAIELADPVKAAHQFIRNLPSTTTEIRCICSSQGYLIVAHKNIISWALFSNLQFNFQSYANNAITGSDSRVPEELVGDVTALVAVPGGFIIFSETNAVAAFYSSTNFAVPWTFRQISGAGGVRSNRNVSRDHIGGKIYAVTTAGLQQISLNSAVSVSPVFDDYLTGKRSESRDEETGKIITGDLTATLQAGCNVIGSRYVVVSCTSNYDNLYEFAWIYDVHLKRWGKVNQVHTGIAQLKESDSPEDMTILDIGPEIPVEMFGEATIDSFVTDPTAEITAYRQQLGLVRPDGSIYRVVLGQGELGEIAPGGFLQVSGLQLTRNRMMTLQRVEFEGTQTATMQLFPSYDGRTVEDAIGTDFWSLVATDEDLTVFGGMITAQNFAFNLQGNFDLSTVIVRATTEGQQ